MIPSAWVLRSLLVTLSIVANIWQKLLEDLEAAQISAQRASDDLEREKDNARRLQQRVRELEPLMVCTLGLLTSALRT